MATKSINFWLTYVPLRPLSQMTWSKDNILAAYFPLSWEAFFLHHCVKGHHLDAHFGNICLVDG